MKKKHYTTAVRKLALLLALLPLGLMAQVTTSFDAGADLMSRYVWRGQNLGGSAPSIQPYAEFTAGGFTLGTWGAITTSGGLSVQENDLYLSYKIKDVVTLLVTDYFVFDEAAGNNHFFEFNQDSTAHLLEAAVSFDGTDKIPFTLMAAVNFWGADALKADGKKQFSSYIELGYNGKCKETEYNIFVGLTPTNPDTKNGEWGYYGEKAGFINIGIKAKKEIKISDSFSLPVSTSFIVNPQSEKVFLVFGISL